MMRKQNAERWVPLADAALRLAVTWQHVYGLALSGRLEARRRTVGRGWEVTERSVIAYAKRRTERLRRAA